MLQSLSCKVKKSIAYIIIKGSKFSGSNKFFINFPSRNIVKVVPKILQQKCKNHSGLHFFPGGIRGLG